MRKLGLWVALVGLLTQSVEANTHQTIGTSGIKCGEHMCLYREAECVHGKCMCKKGLTGQGGFDCHKPQMFNGNTQNDPILKSMNGEKTDMPLTCRYLWTHVVTTYSGWDDSHCDLRVSLFQSKLKGKVFVEGVDLALKISSPIIPSHYGEMSLRTYGNASYGNYTFQEKGQLEFTPDGPYAESQTLEMYMPGEYIHLIHDPFNNRVKFEVAKCGFSMTFRPADPTLGAHQTFIPGASLNINPDNNPQFYSLERSLNIPPDQPHHLQEMADQLGISRQQAQIYKAFMSEVPQNQPDPAHQCTLVPEVIERCPRERLRVAMPTCNFILTRPKVMNCLDGSTNGNTVLKHYGDCIDAICTKCHTCCREVQSAVHHCTRHRGHDEDQAFLQPSTCHFGHREHGRPHLPHFS